MMNSELDNRSVHNLTRDKFDALWKATLRKEILPKKGKTESREQLCSDEGSLEDAEVGAFENLALEDSNEQNEPYILNKFFDESEKYQSEDIMTVKDYVKPPVPKPRRSKTVAQTGQSPAPSCRTFTMSPTLAKDRKPSLSSNKTYNIERDSALWPEVVVNTEEINSDEVALSKNSDTGNESENEIIPHSTDKENKQITHASKDAISNKLYNYENIVEIIIHKTDRLSLNSSVVHPVVKIHVVDIKTGKYFPKSDKNRSVIFFYENVNEDYICPVMTHTCNLQEKRVLLPCWEESILLNEDVEYLKHEIDNIVIFFEILDFLPSVQVKQKGSSRGWHNIAFAFLKMSTNVITTKRIVRLQLYYPKLHQSRKDDPRMCALWTWWNKRKLEKYPSTLYISINSIIPPKMPESFRSQAPIQEESSSKRIIFDNSHEIVQAASSPHPVISTVKTSVNWSKSKYESFKLPNKCLAKLYSYDEGCFIAKFSFSGLYLACAVHCDSLFSIVIYSIQSFLEIRKFPFHHDLIYDIKWSNDDSLIIAASADNTISICSFSQSLLQILPHPSFVYCCDFSNENVIATGCHDKILRVWKQTQKNKKLEYQLFQELEAHQGFITSLCFGKKQNVISADSNGVIIEWQKGNEDWTLKREIHLLDLKETTINQILLFPNEKKLLVHSRDSIIRIIDLKSGCVLRWLRGGFNTRLQIFGGISSCGTFICSGSENGRLHIWITRSGTEVAVCIPFSLDNELLPIHCVTFHPLDNIIMISHYGKKLPILLYSFDKNLEYPEINITTMENECNTTPNEIPKVVDTRINSSGNDINYDYKKVLRKMDMIILKK